MKILLIGSGGREHAIAQKISESSRCSKLYAAPGNAGMRSIAECVDLSADDLEGLLAFAKKNEIDLTLVGPEQPLVMGIVDLFEAEGLKIIGPQKHAAVFEGSKDFTKSFLKRHGIPTADYETYDCVEEAINSIGQFGFPVVIKADGLAAGKGVVIAQNEQEAVQCLQEMMTQRCFGDAGEKVVVESFLRGVETSVLCFCDGKTLKPMTSAQDYKKAYDGDRGLNTGGMGAYSPSLIMDEALTEQIEEKILNPFMQGVQDDGIVFKGILFIGIMVEEGEAKVLEFNVRFGDPETEVILPRMENDLLDVFEAILNESLHEVELSWRKEAAVCVIMASGGYPEKYEKGFEIHGLDQVSSGIYHCGTQEIEGKTLTSGGRVLAVTAMGENLEEAREKAYQKVGEISFEKAFYRKDIGGRFL